MFENTKGIIDKTIKEFNFTVFLISVFSQIVTGGYMVYLCCVRKGALGLNIAMASICAVYFVLALVHFLSDSKAQKKQVGEAKSVLKRIKLAVKTAMLAISVYGIYIADKDASGIAIILATLSIIMWILEVLFEIILSYLKIRSTQFIEALKSDINVSTLTHKAADYIKEKAQDIVDNADKAFDKACDTVIDIGAAVAKSTVHRYNPFKKLKEKRALKKALAAAEQEKLPQPK